MSASNIQTSSCFRVATVAWGNNRKPRWTRKFKELPEKAKHMERERERAGMGGRKWARKTKRWTEFREKKELLGVWNRKKRRRTACSGATKAPLIHNDCRAERMLNPPERKKERRRGKQVQTPENKRGNRVEGMEVKVEPPGQIKKRPAAPSLYRRLDWTPAEIRPQRLQQPPKHVFFTTGMNKQRVQLSSQLFVWRKRWKITSIKAWKVLRCSVRWK